MTNFIDKVSLSALNSQLYKIGSNIKFISHYLLSFFFLHKESCKSAIFEVRSVRSFCKLPLPLIVDQFTKQECHVKKNPVPHPKGGYSFMM